jgi:hypothetical protein
MVYFNSICLALPQQILNMIEPISGVSKPSPQVHRLALAMSLQKGLLWEVS